MNSVMVMGIYAPFFTVALVISLLMLMRQNKNTMDKLFLSISLLLVGWFLADYLSFLFYVPGMERFIYGSFLLFLPFIPPAIFLMSIAFHKKDFGEARSLIFVAVYIIPVITAILAFTSEFHGLIFREFEIVEFWPTQYVQLRWGSWFWVHSITSYLFLLATMVFILVKFFKMPPVYRAPAVMIMLVMFITAIISVFKIFGYFPGTIDPTIIGSTISLMLFYIGVVNNNEIVFVGLSRETVFQYITDFLVVLDADGHVADSNASAQAWFSSQNVKLEGRLFCDVLKQLENQGAELIHPTGENAEDKAIDIRIPTKPIDMVVSMRMHPMGSDKNKSIGTVVILYDVTHNRMLQRRLENTAKLDVLTGLPNRTAYAGAQNRLNAPERLPLTVVMCDINGLKRANDLNGHDYGDRYIQTAAQVLQENCPPNGFLARIGGDEFVYLLPNTELETGLELISAVQTAFETRDRSEYDVSVAMGASTKTSPEQDFTKIFIQADKSMYIHKKSMKSAGNKPYIGVN